MAKNFWFKHYNTAHEGQTIAQLWSEKGGGEIVGFYWTVLELVSRFEDDQVRGKWDGKLSIFKTKLGMNRQRSRKLLQKISETFEIKILWKSDESFELYVPKFLELQETRGGKREAKKEQNTDRDKSIDLRDKSLELELELRDTKKNKNTPTAIRAKPDSVESNISIGLYFSLYKNRYEGKAPLTGKHFSIIKNIIKSNGVDRTNQLLEAYFKMPDTYFVKRRHDVETFNSNLNQIAHYADTGSIITNNFADTRTANNAEALRKAMESVNE